MVLFIDHVVAGLFVFFQLFTANKLRNNRVRLIVLVGRLFGWTRDDQRSARFVDQDRIDFINDRVIMAALYTRREIELHVVAQIVEAELVICSVGDVGSVCCLPLEIVHVVLDDADFQTEEAIYLAHPFGVARGEVVVDRNNVDATTRQRVKVSRQRCHQRLAFASAHFGNLTLV